MIFNDSIVIDASPDKVWKYVGSPDLWGLFHEKAHNCEQISPQGGRIGSLYSMEFRMGEEATPTRSEIIGLKPGIMIKVKSTTITPNQPHRSAILTYELEDLGTSTKVIEQVEIIAPELSRFSGMILRLVSKFGQGNHSKSGEPSSSTASIPCPCPLFRG